MPSSSQFAGKRDQGLHVGISVGLDVIADAEEIAQRMFPAAGDDHRPGLAADLANDMPAEMLDDDFDLLADGRRVERGEAGDTALRAAPFQFGVVLDGFFELIIGLVGHAVLEHVQNEALLDGLAHRIEVERLRQPVRALGAEALQRHVARRGGEGEIADVGLRPTRDLVFGDQILDIVAGLTLVARQGVAHRLGALARLAAVGLVDNDGEGA